MAVRRIPTQARTRLLVAIVVLEVPLVLFMITIALGLLPFAWIAPLRIPVVIVMIVLFLAMVFAAQQIIPWTELSWAKLRSPEILGAIGTGTLTLLGHVVLISTLLGPPPATAEGQALIQNTIDTQGQETSDKLDEIGDAIDDLGPATGGDLTDIKAQITALTGEWSLDGYIDAIMIRNPEITGLYLQSGMDATTKHLGASAILFGMQNELSGDAVELIKTYQAAGYDLDESLVDPVILQHYTDLLPPYWDGPDTPAGYGGGQFAGPLLLWVVIKATGLGPTDEDTAVIDYLAASGADCTVTRSFLEDTRPANDDGYYDEYGGFEFQSGYDIYQQLKDC